MISHILVVLLLLFLPPLLIPPHPGVFHLLARRGPWLGKVGIVKVFSP